MTASIKIDAESRVKKSLSFALLAIIILELFFSGIARFGYTNDYIYSNSVVNAESSIQLIDLYDLKEKSLGVSIFNDSLYLFPDQNYNFVNECPSSHKHFNRLHSRSPPKV